MGKTTPIEQAVGCGGTWQPNQVMALFWLAQIPSQTVKVAG